ncbi:multicopy suppressor of BFA (Brefeldin A) [Savitreella phatthalungensis]
MSAATNGSTKAAPAGAAGAAAAQSKSNSNNKDSSSAAAPNSSNGNGSSTARVTKPDEQEFNKNLAKAEAELKSITSKLEAVRAKIGGSADGATGNSRTAELKKELEEIRSKQASIKGSKAKVFEQVKQLDDSIKRKITESQASKKKSSFKSVGELDAEVKRLEDAVASGSLKLVEEKKALQEVSQLKRQRKLFAEADGAQGSIEADRAKVAELRKQIDEEGNKKLSARYDAIKAELDKLRGEQDVVFKGRKELYAERDNLQQKRNDAYTQLKQLKDNYYTQKKQAYEYSREQRQKRFDSIKQQREQEEKQKRLDAAKEKLDAAKEPAYALQILTCQNLIRYFDPSAGPNASSGGSADEQSTFARSFTGGKTLEKRTVEAAPEGVALASKKDRQDEVAYFAGGKSKKNKGQKSSSAATDSKFNLSLGTIQDLGLVGVSPPMNATDVPRATTDLKTRLQWFKDHEAEETARKTAKAQKEIDAAEAAYEKTKLAEQQQEGAPSSADASSASASSSKKAAAGAASGSGAPAWATKNGDAVHAATESLGNLTTG